MVGVAQLVEHRVVAPVVVGSSPITHPTLPLKKGSDLKIAAFFVLEHSGYPTFLFNHAGREVEIAL
jgi:hypothetical protein